MSLISVDRSLIMEQLGDVLAAAESLAQPADPGVYSGQSTAVEEFLGLCGRLTACGSAYYGALSADVTRAGAMLEQLMSEDRQMGVMIADE